MSDPFPAVFYSFRHSKHFFWGMRPNCFSLLLLSIRLFVRTSVVWRLNSQTGKRPPPTERSKGGGSSSTPTGKRLSPPSSLSLLPPPFSACRFRWFSSSAPDHSRSPLSTIPALALSTMASSSLKVSFGGGTNLSNTTADWETLKCRKEWQCSGETKWSGGNLLSLRPHCHALLCCKHDLWFSIKIFCLRSRGICAKICQASM